VYVWYDRRFKRYYIGCHWGREDDCYICSSTWMRNSYRRRPQDFKRKIISRIYTNKKDLLKEEYRWLSMIKDEELRTRYYNLSKKHFGHWSANDNKSSTSEKISQHHKNDPNWGSWAIGKTVSEKTKQILRECTNKQFSDPKNREIQRQKSLELWKNPEYVKLQKENHKKPRPNRQGVTTNVKKHPITDGVKIWETRKECQKEFGGGGLQHKLKTGKLWFI
jgi:hypothetical protein